MRTPPRTARRWRRPAARSAWAAASRRAASLRSARPRSSRLGDVGRLPATSATATPHRSCASETGAARPASLAVGGTPVVASRCRARRHHGLRPGRVARSPAASSDRATRSRSSTRTPTPSAGSARTSAARTVTGRRLRPRGADRGRHRARRRLRRGQQRRQLQHHRGPGGPRDVRRPARRGPHLRPGPRRGLRAARHPHRRHRALDRRPDAAAAAAGERREPWRDPTGTVRLDAVTATEAWVGRAASRAQEAAPAPASPWLDRLGEGDAADRDDGAAGRRPARTLVDRARRTPEHVPSTVGSSTARQGGEH